MSIKILVAHHKLKCDLYRSNMLTTTNSYKTAGSLLEKKYRRSKLEYKGRSLYSTHRIAGHLLCRCFIKFNMKCPLLIPNAPIKITRHRHLYRHHRWRNMPKS